MTKLCTLQDYATLLTHSHTAAAATGNTCLGGAAIPAHHGDFTAGILFLSAASEGLSLSSWDLHLAFLRFQGILCLISFKLNLTVHTYGDG